MFQAAEKKNKPLAKQSDPHKMATATQQTAETMETEVISYQQLIKGFDVLEKGLVDKFSGLLKPLTEGLEKLNTSLLQVSKMAEETKAITLKQQSDIMNLYNNDKIQEQLVALSNRAHF